MKARYKEVSEEKSLGATFTPKSLADFVAEEIVKIAPIRHLNRPVKVLDPALGTGNLLVSLLEKLINTYKNISIEAYGFEKNEQTLRSAIIRLKKMFPEVTFSFYNADFLEFVLQHVGIEGKNLFCLSSPTKFDLIIANPPYVRTQILGADQARAWAKHFNLSGRIDLYYAFLLGIGEVLTPGGIAGIIVSNRFMTTKSGYAVRRALREQFIIHHVWDLGDTKLFRAAVLPAVLLLEKANPNLRTNGKTHKPKFTSIYETDQPAEYKARDPIAALAYQGIVEIDDGRRFFVQHGTLDDSGHSGAFWRISTKKTDAWLRTVKEHTWGTFRDIGRVRVGVKTTADKVFIRSDWNEISYEERPEAQLLHPLMTHHVARRFKPKQPIKQILYPYCSKNGRRVPIDLSKYPRTAAYLEKHRSILEARKYVLESGREWFEIWVPHNPSDWAKVKLVFRDIAENPTFWIDLSGAIVNGDCYWMICDNEANVDLLWLALAIGNSTFIKAFYDHMFNVRLYAKRRRFMSQYVEKFPLPDPKRPITKEIIATAQQIYQITPSNESHILEQDLDRMVWQAFGLAYEKVSG